MQSLYKVINFRCVQLVFSSSIWEIKVPPRVQYFLWLLSKNKLLTRDNLSKRREVEDKTCLFYIELESIQHLFFDCAVAQQMWAYLSSISGCLLGGSFDDIGKFWLSNKRNGVLNIITSAALWCLWKLRNDICFQRCMWRSMEMLLYRLAAMVQKWEIICPEEKKETLRLKVERIKEVAGQVHWLPWIGTGGGRVPQLPSISNQARCSEASESSQANLMLTQNDPSSVTI